MLYSSISFIHFSILKTWFSPLNGAESERTSTKQIHRRSIEAAHDIHFIHRSFVVRNSKRERARSLASSSLKLYSMVIAIALLLLLMLVIFFTFANYTMSAKNVFNGHVATKVCCAKRDIVRTQAKIIRPTKHQRKKNPNECLNWIKYS